MPRARSAWQRSRPSASGKPMSITSASTSVWPIRASASAPVPTASTTNPSSSRPRPSRLRSSSSSSTTRTVWPTLTCGLSSFFAQNRAELESADQQRRKPGGGNRARYGGAAESAEEPPGHGETIRRRVEDVLEHGDQHFREQPAEQRGQRERPREHEDRLAPEKRRHLAQ